MTSHFNSWKTSFKLAKNKDPEFSDYKAKMLQAMQNLELQQPQRGRLSTRNINFMSQNSDYDSDNNLDTVYNVLLMQCNNLDKETTVDIMQALRKTGRPV